MHHGAHADGGQLFDFAVVLSLHVLAKVGIAVLQSVPDSFDAVGPESVDELVLPLVRTLCDGLVLLVDEDGLDAGRAKLDTENGFTAFNYLLFFHKNCVLCTEVTEKTEVREVIA